MTSKEKEIQKALKQVNSVNPMLATLLNQGIAKAKNGEMKGEYLHNFFHRVKGLSNFSDSFFSNITDSIEKINELTKNA